MAKRRRHGEGSIHQRSRDGKWVGVADLGTRTGPDGKRRRIRKTVTATSEAEAGRKLRKILRDHEQGIRATGLTVDKWMTRWLDDAEADGSMKAKTVVSYRDWQSRYITPYIGMKRIDALTPEDVKQMHRDLRRRGLSDTTIQHAHRALQRALRVAMQRSILGRNVAQMIGAPDIDDSPHDVLTAEESIAVLRSVAGDPRLRARMACGLTLGMRPGEVLGLQWGDLEIIGDTGVVHVRRAVQQITGRGLVVDTLKTDRSRRTVPLPPITAMALAAWRQAQGGSDTDYVFHGAGGLGDPERPRRDYGTWRDALRAAKVRHVPPYGGRGSTASLLMALKVPDRVIADILGHTTVKTTQRHYLHSDDAQRLAAMELLGAALDPSSAELVPHGGPLKDIRSKLPETLVDRIDDLAADADVTRSAWIAEALTRVVAEIEKHAAPHAAS